MKPAIRTLWNRLPIAFALAALPFSAAAAPTMSTVQGHNINPARVVELRPVSYVVAGGWIVLEAPNDEWAVNYAETREGNLEWFSHERNARLGIKAEPKTPGWAARSAVSALVRTLREQGGGEWTAPREYSVAGIPTFRATGHGVRGNYFFDIYAWERHGMQYLAYLRTPYENRWNRELNADLAYFITHSHPSTAAVLKALIK